MICFSCTWVLTDLKFSLYNDGILSMDHTGNTTPTRKKVIPYVRFETLKHVKNLSLLGGTRSPQI